jgi:FMN phosphatase YigB (HAD superfamily)
MTKALVFDMDGTIADLYGVENWLEDLMDESPRPYQVADPIYNPIVLNSTLEMLKERGWKIIVTTWLSKGGSKEYNNIVRQAKLEWLEKYDFPYDEIHIVKYGTTKANCTRRHGGFQILVDDNKKVRDGWKLGSTINANKDIIKELWKLVK